MMSPTNRSEDEVGNEGNSTQSRLGFFDTPFHCMSLSLGGLALVFAGLSAYQASVAWNPDTWYSGNNTWAIHAKYAMIFGFVALVLAFFQPPVIYMAARHFERKRNVQGWLSLKVAGFLGYAAAWVHGALLLKRAVDEGCAIHGCNIPVSSIFATVGLAVVPWALMLGYAESARLGGKGDEETPNTPEGGKDETETVVSSEEEDFEA